jgi:hypothetical protein
MKQECYLPNCDIHCDRNVLLISESSSSFQVGQNKKIVKHRNINVLMWCFFCGAGVNVIDKEDYPPL